MATSLPMAPKLRAASPNAAPSAISFGNNCGARAINRSLTYAVTIGWLRDFLRRDAASRLANAGENGATYILQANDVDPTAPTSQPEGRWYHWLGCDPAVTHLETGIAVDAGQFAGRGQRIDVQWQAPIVAVQVKIKRIGQPGALCWEAGTAWGRRRPRQGRGAGQFHSCQLRALCHVAAGVHASTDHLSSPSGSFGPMPGRLLCHLLYVEAEPSEKGRSPQVMAGRTKWA